jgi:antitoxin HicB
MAYFPDLPGCVADGETIEEALKDANQALESWLSTAKEFGDPIPVASSSENFSGQTRLRLPKSLHAELNIRAKEEGVSLNTLAVTLLARGLGVGKQ